MLRVSLLVLSLAAFASSNAPEDLKDLAKNYAFGAACIGEKNADYIHDKTITTLKNCQSQPIMFTNEEIFGQELASHLPGTQPNSPKIESIIKEALQGNSDDKEKKFLKSIIELKLETVARLSNLTCAMTTIGLWNQDKSINMEYLTKTKWENMPEQVDEDFKQLVIKKTNACFKVASNLEIPSDALPYRQTFFRQKIFHQCLVKKKSDACTAKILSDLMLKKFPDYATEAKKLGLPEDKYHGAIIAFLAKHKAMPSTAKAVKNFLNTGDLF